MSRIGKKPIELKDSVQTTSVDGLVTVTGPRGSLQVRLPEGIEAHQDASTLSVVRSDESRRGASNHGMVRSLLQGAVTGVSEGYRKQLEIQGIGYRGQCNGRKLFLNLGFSHTVEYEIPEGVSLSMPDITHITVEGIDKQLVGQTAAVIRSFRPPDSYKGKGIRYVGEQVALKEGKTVG